MNIFFTSDQHFGHGGKDGKSGIIKLAKRGFLDVEEMDDYMIQKWNSVVKRGDIVYHLGDFAWSVEAGRRALHNLNGTTHLLEGNHEVSSLFKHFASVSIYKEIELDNQKIILFHYPMRSWNGIFKGSWHLHGHTHNLIKPFGKSFDVGVDAVGYVPLTFEQVKEMMDKRPKQTEEEGFSNYAEIKSMG